MRSDPGPGVQAPELHPDLAPLSFLLGRWEGAGVGGYPTIESFRFGQEITFSHNGKPFLIYTSRTWRLDEEGRDAILVTESAESDGPRWKRVRWHERNSAEGRVYSGDFKTAYLLNQDRGTATGQRPSSLVRKINLETLREERALFLGRNYERLDQGPTGLVLTTFVLGQGPESLVLDPVTLHTRSWPMPSGQGSSPYAVAVGASGTVWVAEFMGDRIVRFDPATERMTAIALPTPRSRVRALAADTEGRVWYAGSASGRLGVIE